MIHLLLQRSCFGFFLLISDHLLTYEHVYIYTYVLSHLLILNLKCDETGFDDV